ncbi:ribonuclease domain-containing protein [Corynebacterium crudilactis]|uniref:Ribonuclease n=1 Tax=Corynebacterium crudilactis TaxID=1652495 RepID=A0A172QUW8_9CORY|nr:ribonuclease domain-containing protein [Corynebacterium crudilactis]ANE04497.1 ribonuclease [Corynebacterium crudilactis]
MQNGKKTLGGVLGVIVVLAAAWFGIDLSTSNQPSNMATPTSSNTPTTEPISSDDGGSCSLTELPQKADEVVDDILAGGPFDYPNNDGVRFGNYEGVLPKQANNYYREYTVETPGLNHRGPLRIVTGGSNAQDPEVWYYTSDHYESFCAIVDAEN